ncbi:hypothetical protein VL15_34155 [Burkholderia cepacia]|uniref:Uncharacterized protein n=1 Tax=Burkholderia cepacia TaxID=292 RepID=A0A0J5W857_BURCE|nr:hypothetical protein VL15_34155 [Burkholderia cepacia]
MQAGAAGGGRVEACILPAAGPGRRRGERPGGPLRTGAGAAFARDGTRRPAAAGIVPRRW